MASSILEDSLEGITDVTPEETLIPEQTIEPTETIEPNTLPTVNADNIKEYLTAAESLAYIKSVVSSQDRLDKAFSLEAFAMMSPVVDYLAESKITSASSTNNTSIVVKELNKFTDRVDSLRTLAYSDFNKIVDIITMFSNTRLAPVQLALNEFVIKMEMYSSKLLGTKLLLTNGDKSINVLDLTIKEYIDLVSISSPDRYDFSYKNYETELVNKMRSFIYHPDHDKFIKLLMTNGTSNTAIANLISVVHGGARHLVRRLDSIIKIIPELSICPEDAEKMFTSTGSILAAMTELDEFYKLWNKEDAIYKVFLATLEEL